MAQKILFILALTFHGRILQKSTANPAFFKADKNRVFTKASLQNNCFLKISSKLHVHRSFYCFKKQKGLKGTQMILSASSKTKPPLLRPVVQVFVPMKKWGKIFFL